MRRRRDPDRTSALDPGLDEQAVRRLAARIRCPVVVIHGSEDAIRSPQSGAALADLISGTFVASKDPGIVPRLAIRSRSTCIVRDFVEPRRKRDLRLDAGHSAAAQGAVHLLADRPRPRVRDVAIARELRKLHPGLEIDWLAQDPVTRVLEAEGERIHPASAELASESGHIESESAEHDLHCFQAWRRMDEILVNNFMVFHDLVEAEPYDLWIGDEAWEVDYFLHENPELKRAAYCWLTDFVGWLPMPDGGEREAFLTADYNAEMVEHIDRFPRLRDRAIFVGNPEDIVPDRLGPEMPLIREWTEQHFDFAGLRHRVRSRGRFADREALRAELGYGER